MAGCLMGQGILKRFPSVPVFTYPTLVIKCDKEDATMRSVESNLGGVVVNVNINFTYTCFKGTLSLDCGRVMGSCWWPFHIFLCSQWTSVRRQQRFCH